MLASFKGGGDITKAYETTLYDSTVDLTIIEAGLGASAINRLCQVACLKDTDQKTEELQELLYNELPNLEEAESKISEWAKTADLPEELVIIPTLEGPVSERHGPTFPHFDAATAINAVMHGPFAISIGTRAERLFKGLRYTRRLTNDELLGLESSHLPFFERVSVENGDIVAATSRATQGPGDIVLIPGSPHPSLHGVLIEEGSRASSVISSYVITALEGLSPSELRQRMTEERDAENRFIVAALSKLVGLNKNSAKVTKPMADFAKLLGRD